jgi:hypothetical protein
MLAAMSVHGADEAELSYGAPSSSAVSLPAPRSPPLSAEEALAAAGASLPAMSFFQAASVADASAAQGLVQGAVARARQSLADARPWREFYDARAIRLPAFSEVTERVEMNAKIFHGNYKIVACVWCAFALLMSFGRFLAAALMLFAVERWVRFKVRSEGSLDFGEKAAACAVSLTIVWVTGVGRLVVESFMVACLSVGIHSVLRTPPELNPGREMV